MLIVAAPTVVIVSGASTIISEMLVVVTTWRHSYRNVKLARDSEIQIPLSKTLLRDGQCAYDYIYCL